MATQRSAIEDSSTVVFNDIEMADNATLCCDADYYFDFALYQASSQQLLGETPLCLAFSPIPIALSVCRPSVCRLVCCGQTVQDRHIVCIEVEWERGDEILIDRHRFWSP